MTRWLARRMTDACRFQRSLRLKCLPSFSLYFLLWYDWFLYVCGSRQFLRARVKMNDARMKDRLPFWCVVRSGHSTFAECLTSSSESLFSISSVVMLLSRFRALMTAANDNPAVCSMETPSDPSFVPHPLRARFCPFCLSREACSMSPARYSLQPTIDVDGVAKS